MQIKNLSNVNFNAVTSVKNRYNLNNAADCTVFKGNIEQKNETVKEAEDFGLNVYALSQNGKLSIGAIQKEARKNIPNIKVENINELKKIFGKSYDVSRFKAYLMPQYQKDCKLHGLIMFINDKKNDTQKIGSIAHEYTHALQYGKSDDYLGLAPIVGNDLYKARALNSFGAYVFDSLEQNLKIGEIFDEAARISDDENLDMKSAFVKAGGFKDEKECKKAFKHCFLVGYDMVQEELSKSPDYFYVPFRDDPLKLKKTIRNLCKTKAEREKEAYTVQKNVISAIDKNSLTSENRVNPVFYEILIDALS